MDERLEKHLSELRRILVHSALVLIVAYVILLFAFPLIFRSIVSRIGATVSTVYAFGIGDIIGFYFTAPAVMAILIGFPIILIMFYRWAEDALLPEEKRFITRYAKISALFFIVGIVLSFFLVPRLVDLSNYFGESLGVTVIYSAKELFNIWLTLAVLLGIVFQFPVLLSLLIRMGVVNKDFLRSIRIYVYPFFYLLAAVITPGDLIVTDVILLAIFVALYEASIAFSRAPKRSGDSS